MSWFINAISGRLGEGPYNVAESEAQKAVASASKDAVKDSDGALKWRSNGRYLMNDMVEMLEHKGFDFSAEATNKKREDQDRAFIDEYQSRPHEISDEELFEMRAAFGPGETIVDVFTGKKIQL